MELFYGWFLPIIRGMLERKDGFVSMPEVQTERLRTNLDLPFGLENQIDLNVRRIQTLMQI